MHFASALEGDRTLAKTRGVLNKQANVGKKLEDYFGSTLILHFDALIHFLSTLLNTEYVNHRTHYHGSHFDWQNDAQFPVAYSLSLLEKYCTQMAAILLSPKCHVCNSFLLSLKINALEINFLREINFHEILKEY